MKFKFDLNKLKTAAEANKVIIFKIASVLCMLLLLFFIIFSIRLNSLLNNSIGENNNLWNCVKYIAGLIDKNAGTSIVEHVRNKSLVQVNHATEEAIDGVYKKCVDSIQLNQDLVSAIIQISRIGGIPAEYSNDSFSKNPEAKQTLNDILAYMQRLDAKNKKVTESLNYIVDILKKSQSSEAAGIRPFSMLDIEFNEQLFSFITNSIANLQNSSSKAIFTIQEKDNMINNLQDKLKAVTEDLESKSDKLSVSDKEIDALNSKIEEMKAEIEKLKENGDSTKSKDQEEPEDVPVKSPPVPTGPQYYTNLTGTVSDYNSHAGFVIINIGKVTKVSVTENGQTRIIDVEIPTDKEFYISDGVDVIARAKVTKAYKDYSVAEIMTVSAGRGIDIGDHVYYPTEVPVK